MSLYRAAIYCRCSTEEESQMDALKNQIAESIACVNQQGWFLAEQYVESKSGTTTKGRQEYNRLFKDLLLDKFDIIVIKSQDRLMRNVKDWYLFLDRMLTCGKRLYMYLDHKFYSADDALITGIKAILAEEYSRELSKKINNAHQNRQKNGGKTMLTSRVFGFHKQADGSVTIDETEAAVIRKIYGYCANGCGCRTIANILLGEGIKKRSGKPITSGFIGRMIRNPLYKGVFVMNRLHYDFDTKKTVKTPESQWIYDTRAVPAIVDEQLWEDANLAMTERTLRISDHDTCIKGNSPGQYELSGKIICGLCGRPYYRTWRKSHTSPGETIIEWKCCTYLEKGRKQNNRKENIKKALREINEGCDNIHLKEQTVFSLLEQVSSRYYDLKDQDKERIINHTIQILQEALPQNTSENTWQKLKSEETRIMKQKEMLLTKLLDGIITDSDYQKRNLSLDDKLMVLKQQKEAAKPKEQEINNMQQRIETIKSRLRDGGVERAGAFKLLTEIQHIAVFEWHLEIVFDPLKIAGLKNECADIFSLSEMDKALTFSIDYPFSPNTDRGRFLDKVKIINIMKETPEVTAKKIAAKIDRPVKLVQNRIKELRNGGYICFQGKGGHGKWKVLNPNIQYDGF